MEKLVLTQRMLTPIKESLINGLTIASGAKSTATYYHSKDEQMVAIKIQIDKLYNVSKELPLIIASQKGATGRFVSEVLLNEFRRTLRGGACNIINPIDWYDNGLSDKAVLSALENLAENGLPYVLRLFVDMKLSKINNERMRKIGLGFIWGQSNLEFYSMKYRNKLADVLRHIYGQRKTSILLSIARKVVNNRLLINEKEGNIIYTLIGKYYDGDIEHASKLLLFIFKGDDGIDYSSIEFPMISEYQLAKTDINSLSVVPEEIVLGLISSPNHPQHSIMWSTDTQKETTKALIRKNVKVTSVNQQVRQTKSTAKLGVNKTVNLEKVTDFLALYKTGFETSFTREIGVAIDKLAEKKRILNFYYNNIGIIIDESNSMRGHKVESKNTPRAIADFTAKVLNKSAKSGTIVRTDGEVTDIATSFIELIKKEDSTKEYDAIFIITDGYENSYDGLTNEVISIWKAESGRELPIFQISPITGAETGANVRKLSDSVVTMAINSPAAIQPQIDARLLEIDTKKWLENQVGLIELTNVSRNKKKIKLTNKNLYHE